MLYRDISKILGLFLLGFSAAFLLPLMIAGYYEFFADPSSHPQPHTTLHFFESFVCCLLIGGIFYALGIKSQGNLYRREALALVVIIWLLTPMVAALPFKFSGTLKNPVQAYFESASGLTTTGSTIIQTKKFDPETGQEIPIIKNVCGSLDVEYTFWGNVDPVKDPSSGKVYEGIEALGKGLLFWRSFLHFLGGGGIVLLFIGIMPALGLGGKMLLQAELSGSPVKGSLAPRMNESSHLLWKIYVGLTLTQVFLLMLTNSEISFFDATTVSFATLSTGGFTIHNASIGYYQNAYTDWIIVLFMILGSISFPLYFYVLKGKFYKLYEPEFIIFLLVIFFSCGICVWCLTGTEKRFFGSDPGIFSLAEAIRYGCFQVVSILTTTGFAIADYDYWPYPIQVMLLLMMFVGGMSGSTAGGFKILRGYMLARIGGHTIESLYRPDTVRQFRLGEREINHESVRLVLVFFLTLVTVTIGATFIYVLSGVDPETSLGFVSAMITNTGVGFRIAGPYDSMAFLSDSGLLFATFLMILGRLEFFAVLAVLIPAFWKTNS
ncbi:MAG: potassium uptake system, Trk family protein [Chlamydiales bacterium 38-26]|nr:TrkH family potassium uptake protein [Chlamydiales bacterium]OJV11247.1 MAG: potassium uptake system, Trk family protein [Chlamydiales bacterium 38-26]